MNSKIFLFATCFFIILANSVFGSAVSYKINYNSYDDGYNSRVSFESRYWSGYDGYSTHFDSRAKEGYLPNGAYEKKYTLTYINRAIPQNRNYYYRHSPNYYEYDDRWYQKYWRTYPSYRKYYYFNYGEEPCYSYYCRNY